MHKEVFFTRALSGFLLIVFMVPFGLCLAAGAGEKTLTETAVAVESDRLLSPPEDFSPPTDYTVSEHQPEVYFVRYPLPDTPASPWSHWGIGALLPDGRVLTPIGDHRAIDGNSYLYEYDPRTKELRLAADLQSAVDEVGEGDFGFGKIHDRLNVGKDGKVYFGSYWGVRSGHDEKFRGERIFRYDPDKRELTDLGMPMAGWGDPSSNFSPEHNLFYGEITYRADYDNETRGRKFFAFDVETGETRFAGGHEGTGYGRDFFVDGEGNAYFNNGNRTLMKYDPEKNELQDLGPVMPISRLRRTAGPCPDGVLYATSHDKDDSGSRVLFSFDPATSETRTITAIWEDTPSMALGPAGRYVYMVPGNVRYPGRPLVRVDIESGATEVVAFLQEAIKENFDFSPGGSYGLVVDDDTAYIQFGIRNDLSFVTVELPD